MKILFLIRSLHFGGAERQITLLAKGLVKRGHSVTILTFYPGGPLESELNGTDVKIRSLNKKGRWDTFSFIFKLFSILKNEKPDIIHSYLTVSNILTSLYKIFNRNKKVVLGIRASDMDLSKYDRLTSLTYKVESKLAHYSDLIISNSYAGKKFSASNGFPDDKMIVIHNGIDINRFSPNNEYRTNYRKLLTIQENEIVIAIIARIDPMKDHSTFIKAADLLCKKFANVKFYCIGNGDPEYKNELIKLTHKLHIQDKITFLAASTEMPQIYNAIDILTSSSSYGEGFSNVIGEAMACGKICVVTDVGDSAIIVGDTGRVFDVGDYQQLSVIWSDLLDKTLNNIEPRQRIVNNFTIEKLIENTEMALEKLLQK